MLAQIKKAIRPKRRSIVDRETIEPPRTIVLSPHSTQKVRQSPSSREEHPFDSSRSYPSLSHMGETTNHSPPSPRSAPFSSDSPPSLLVYTQPQSLFFTLLPPEIRSQIYSLVFPSPPLSTEGNTGRKIHILLHPGFLDNLTLTHKTCKQDTPSPRYSYRPQRLFCMCCPHPYDRKIQFCIPATNWHCQSLTLPLHSCHRFHDEAVPYFYKSVFLSFPSARIFRSFQLAVPRERFALLRHLEIHFEFPAIKGSGRWGSWVNSMKEYKEMISMIAKELRQLRELHLSLSRMGVYYVGSEQENEILEKTAIIQLPGWRKGKDEGEKWEVTLHWNDGRQMRRGWRERTDLPFVVKRILWDECGEKMLPGVPSGE